MPISTPWDALAAQTGAVGMLVGCVGRNPARPGRDLTNAAALPGEWRSWPRGKDPAADVRRSLTRTGTLNPHRKTPRCRFEDIGWITVCEDVWNDGTSGPAISAESAVALADAGADLLLNLPVPWHQARSGPGARCFRVQPSKPGVRSSIATWSGGNDELVFDGQSVAYRGMES